MKNTTKAFFAQIILGTPSIGCQGHGICRALTQSFKSPLKCPSVTAMISLDGDKLRFSFLKSTISAQVREKHFGTPYFRIEEPFLLPARIKAHVQYRHSCILAGDFSITENGQFFMVSF